MESQMCQKNREVQEQEVATLALVLCSDALSWAERIVADWLGDYQDRFLDGGCGDVADLLARLSPVFEKAAMSSSVISSRD